MPIHMMAGIIQSRDHLIKTKHSQCHLIRINFLSYPIKEMNLAFNKEIFINFGICV